MSKSYRKNYKRQSMRHPKDKKYANKITRNNYCINGCYHKKLYNYFWDGYMYSENIMDFMTWSIEHGKTPHEAYDLWTRFYYNK